MLRFRLFQWLVALSVFLMDATVALARAGGGGGYSSGGSSSSSSYSSSSSSSYSGGSGGGGEFTFFDAIVLVVAVVGMIMILRKHRRQMAMRKREREAASRAWADRLSEGGVPFDLDLFERRIRAAFVKIQNAWSAQDLSEVRGFMSDGLHERFSIQLREQAALGYRNQMSGIRIHEFGVVDARRLPHFDIVSVRITASASDCRVDLSTDEEIEGTRRPEHFTEVWSFLRGRGATSSSEAGLFEGQCPNCAAPVRPERAWACESCGSELDAAPPDWVLVEITQSGEWSREKPDEDEWMKAAMVRDPGLTAAQLEDRGSVVFWRLMDANRIGRVDELRGSSRKDFAEAHADVLDRGRARYVGDCAVGAVRIRGIVPGENWDLALLEIRWAGAVYERAPELAGSAPSKPRETGSRSLHRNLLVMARRAGVKSQVGRCIVSAHCVGCGAPDEGAIEDRCRYCGEAFNGGQDWLLDRFLELGDREARALLAEAELGPLDASLRPPDAASSTPTVADSSAPDAAPGGIELFGWVLKLAYADQYIDQRERLELDGVAKRLGLSSPIARKLRKAAQFGRLEVVPPADEVEAGEWMRTVSAMAHADGRIDRREAAILKRLAAHAGIEAPV